jgi:hypothetical protein
VYIIIPLVILSFSLGALMAFSESSNAVDTESSRAFSTLDTKPVSLMCPYTSGNILGEMNAVKDIFTQYNQNYGDRLSINVATGTSATLAEMVGYIKTTQRMQISSDGTWSSTKDPMITMYSGTLDKSAVDLWSLTNGACQFIYLSACDGMGHSGQLDINLCQALLDKTSANGIIAFKDVVDITAATLLSQSFWMFHVAYSAVGGMSSADSYTNAKTRVQNEINIIEISIPILIGTGVAAVATGLQTL